MNASKANAMTRVLRAGGVVILCHVASSTAAGLETTPVEPMLPTANEECRQLGDGYQRLLSDLSKSNLECGRQWALKAPWVDQGAACHEWSGPEATNLGACKAPQPCAAGDNRWHGLALERDAATKRCYHKVRTFKAIQDALAEDERQQELEEENRREQARAAARYDDQQDRDRKSRDDYRNVMKATRDLGRQALRRQRVAQRAFLTSMKQMERVNQMAMEAWRSAFDTYMSAQDSSWLSIGSGTAPSAPCDKKAGYVCGTVGEH